MAKYDGMKFTSAGRTLLAKAIAGTELHFTRVVFGDGPLPDGANIYELTDLIHPVREAPISSIDVTTVGQATITVALTNEGLSMGFFAREIGIFATDPNEGEVLYAYTNSGGYPDYIPGQAGADVYQAILSFVTVIDQAPTVTAVIDGTLVYVTQAELDNRIKQLESQISALFKPATLPISGIWTKTNGDGNVLRPASLDSVKDALGVRGVSGLSRRIDRLEDVTAQILLEIETQNLYPDYSNIILEDFKNPDSVDLYTCKVLTVVAGDDSIDCENAYGLLPGSYYTMTDGLKAELVQVSSVSTENGVNRVILTTPVQHTYRLSDTRIYRSSATLTSDGAEGPGLTKSLSWSPSIVWQGQGADEESIVPLETTIINAESFSVSGSILFTAGGPVTVG
jgi:hypothetical protein